MFLIKINVFNLFSFGGALSTITRTSFITAIFSKSASSTQWTHIRVLFISRDNAG